MIYVNLHVIYVSRSAKDYLCVSRREKISSLGLAV